MSLLIFCLCDLSIKKKKKENNYFIIFGCAVSSLLRELFSSCGKHELFFSCAAPGFSLWGFSYWGAQALVGQQWLELGGSRALAQYCSLHSLCCPLACGIFPDQGSNPCLLCWQASSSPLSHQGRLVCPFFIERYWSLLLWQWIPVFLFAVLWVFASHTLTLCC